MGYALAMGNCVLCRGLFSFNPMRVPSVRINGSKEPLCRDCVERANPLRVAHGLPPIVIMPDAYEACDEGELE